MAAPVPKGIIVITYTPTVGKVGKATIDVHSGERSRPAWSATGHSTSSCWIRKKNQAADVSGNGNTGTLIEHVHDDEPGDGKDRAGAEVRWQQ